MLGCFFTLLLRGGLSILLAFVLAPLGTLLYLMLARISLEALALFFRMGENTSAIAAALGSGAGPNADPPAGFGTPPGGPFGPSPSAPGSVG